MLIQFIIILFALFALWRTIVKFREQEIQKKEFFFWFFFWWLVIGATIWFRQTDLIARYVGVAKGADLAVYLSVLFLFYAVFKILARLEKIERRLTKIARVLALKEAEEDKGKNYGKEKNS